MTKFGCYMVGVVLGTAGATAANIALDILAPSPRREVGVYIYDDGEDNWDRVRERDIEDALRGRCAVVDLSEARP